MKNRITIIDTFYEHYTIGFPKFLWSANLPFACVKCGNCCTIRGFFTAGRVLIGTATEQQLDYMLTKYNAAVEECTNFETEKCPFLTHSNFCEIYEHRPEGCQLFPKTDFGMSTKKGFCESLDRFKRLRKALVGGNSDNYAYQTYFLLKDGIKPVKTTKYQYDRCLARLLKAGISANELELFNKLNGRIPHEKEF